MQEVRSIVLVDDDQDDHELFRSACERIDASLNVLGFQNGEQALKGLSVMRSHPDVIFLDLNMPRLNGVELLQKLKYSSTLKNIPVIIYSTSFDNNVREKCSSLGAMDVMEKPSSFDTLCAKLQTVFCHLG